VCNSTIDGNSSRDGTLGAGEWDRRCAPAVGVRKIPWAVRWAGGVGGSSEPQYEG
jgi:hypothetical protein